MRAVALLAALGLALPLSGAFAGHASVAVVPHEAAVYPADPSAITIADKLLFAGTDGYLHEPDGTTQPIWTTYATGASVPVTAVPAATQYLAAGNDTAGLLQNGALVEIDLTTMTVRSFPLPTGAGVYAAAGPDILIRLANGAGLETLSFADDGSSTATPVTGLPAGAQIVSGWLGSDALTFLAFTLGAGTPERYALVNAVTAEATVLPADLPRVTGVNFSTDHLALWAGFDTVRTISIYPLAALEAGGDPTPVVVPILRASTFASSYLVGDHMLEVDAGSQSPHPLVEVTPTTQTTLLANVQLGVQVYSFDGTGLLVGGSGPADWSVRRFTDSGGSVTQSNVVPLTAMSNAALTISQGLVRHVEGFVTAAGTVHDQMFNHEVVVDTSNWGFHPLDPYGGALTTPVPCATGSACVRAVDGNDGGESYIATNGATSIALQRLSAANQSGFTTSLPSAGGTLVDASGGYVVVNGTNPTQTYVVGGPPGVTTRPSTATSLWYDTLWAATGPGAVTPTNLDKSTTGASVSTGASCTPTELQATQRWLYWACGTTSAGVVDLQQHVTLTVPAGPALVGDGYLVRHNAAGGDLLMYDFHTGSVSGPVTIASGVPAGPIADDRNIAYAVDRFSGDIAYVDAADAVHVVDPAVPPTAPALGTPVLGGGVLPTIGWVAGIPFTRPVSSWMLQIHRKTTGAVVSTLVGGVTTRGTLATWDGTMAPGVPAYSGFYTLTLSVVPLGSTSAVNAPVTFDDGQPIDRSCGTPTYRGYDCEGGGGFLTVVNKGTTTGQGSWLTWSPYTNTFSNSGHVDDWPLGTSGAGVFSALVPFGDLNGDRLNDLLARNGSGQLWFYPGNGSPGFSNQPRTLLGSGWNIYNLLISTGDVTGDHRPDLLARNAAGQLYRYNGTAAGKLAAKVLVSSGWGSYKKIIGAGDLNGDGKGDLLATDSAGALWRYLGNGTGGFGARVKIGSGWTVYNAVIGVGDMNGDGLNDILGRNSAGALYLYPSTAAGTFTSGHQVSTGWANVNLY